MEIVKADDQLILQAHYTHQGQCYLCITVMGLFQFGDYGRLRSEEDLLEVLEKKIDQDLKLDDGMPKTQGEFFISGHAYAAQPKGQTQGEVSVSVGSVKKRILVFGDRVWTEGLIKNTQSAPENFTRIPLTEAYAFGGPGTPNPQGKGALIPNTESLTTPLPNLELPKHLIVYRKDTPPAATFLPLSTMHPSRLIYLGTLDEKWAKTGWPHFPDDFKVEYFNRAPHDQRISGFFKGDEALWMENVSPSSPQIESSLPGIRFKTFIHTMKGQFQEIPCLLDTVWLFPDVQYGIVMSHMKTPVSCELNEEIAHVYSITETLVTPQKPLEVHEAEFKEKCQLSKPAIQQDAPKFSAAETATEANPLTLNPAASISSNMATIASATAGIAAGASAGIALERDVDPVELDIVHQMMRDEKALNRSKEHTQSLNAKRSAAEANAQLAEYKRLMTEAGFGEQVANDASPITPQDLPPGVKKALAGDDPALLAQNLEASTGLKMTEPGLPPPELQQLGQAAESPAAYNQLMSTADQLIAAGALLAAAQGLDPKDPEIAKQIQQYESESRQLKATMNEDILKSQQALQEAKASQPEVPLDSKLASGNPAQKIQASDDTIANASSSTQATDSDSDEEADEPSEKVFASFADQLKSGNTKGLDLSRYPLQGILLPGFDFSGIILEGTHFKNAVLTGAIFSGCLLAGAQFEGANLSGATFEGVDASNVNFKNANLNGAIFKKADCDSAQFENASLKDCQTEHSNFSHSQFKNVALSGRFLNSQFNEVKWEQVDITGFNAVGCQFDNSSWKAIHGPQVSFTHCDFDTMTIEDAQFQKSQWAHSTWSKSRIQNANFTESDFSTSSFTKVVFEKSIFTQSTMIGAQFTACTGENALFDQVNLSEGSLDSSRFKGSSFSKANLTQVNANKGDFSDCKMDHVQGRKILFSETNLSNADCSSSDFLDGNFSFSRCVGTCFDHANLYNAQFYRAIIDDASFIQIIAKEGFMQQLVLLKRTPVVLTES